jgi:hypothetical protein
MGRPDSGGVLPLDPDDREIGLMRVWRALFWTLWLGAALVAPAAGQNLDAGKPPAQIFSEVCAACHKSVRDFKGGVSSSFLREHYTISADMASTMAAYLSGVRSDPRGAPSSPSPKPAGTPAAARDTGTTDTQRGRTPQTSEPKAEPKSAQAPTPPPAPNRTTRVGPGTARADASKPAEAKPLQPPLEEFEE